jgi:hypothetical protein
MSLTKLNMKVCTQCKKNQPRSSFSRRSRSPDGLRYDCKLCALKAQQKWKRKQKNKNTNTQSTNTKNDTVIVVGTTIMRGLFEFWRTHPCVDCGESRPLCLEFDLNVNDAASNILLERYDNWPQILKVIEKYQVRCANCKKINTAVQFDWYKGLV